MLLLGSPLRILIMKHNTLHPRSHPHSLESENRGERKTESKYIRRRAGAAGALGAVAATLALGIGIAKSGSNESGQPLWQQMDATIERELQKGPTGADTVVYDGTIGTGNTLQSIIAREHPNSELNDSMLQHKASNASAHESQSENEFLQPTDEAVVWQDAELEQRFGQVAILAAPVER